MSSLVVSDFTLMFLTLVNLAEASVFNVTLGMLVTLVKMDFISRSLHVLLAIRTVKLVRALQQNVSLANNLLLTNGSGISPVLQVAELDISKSQEMFVTLVHLAVPLAAQQNVSLVTPVIRKKIISALILVELDGTTEELNAKNAIRNVPPAPVVHRTVSPAPLVTLKPLHHAQHVLLLVQPARPLQPLVPPALVAYTSQETLASIQCLAHQKPTLRTTFVNLATFHVITA